MRWMISMVVCSLVGCATPDSGTGGSAEGSGDGSADDDDGATSGGGNDTRADDATADDGSTTTGDISMCDPSDPDIGPAVAVSIVNQTAAPLYFTEAESCAFGSPFGIARGREAIAWIIGICASCADALEGLCFCPAACAQDTVVRVDPGGHYEGAWPGSVIFNAVLEPACVTEECGESCLALAQADAGDYTAIAVASPMVDCGGPTCDCAGAPDPDGWCSIVGVRAGGDVPIETAFAYPRETSVELVFQ